MALPDVYRGEDAEPEQPEVSKRSRGVALGLCFFGGVFGLHRFYVGKVQTGVAMIVTFGGLGIWWLYDLVLIAAGEFRDADDVPLRNWAVDDQGAAGRVARLTGPAERRVEEVEDQLDALRDQFNDLAERVDFAERMLAQQRDKPQLPRG
jgi:TM2 domain-containing membrane protein YozV